MLNNTVEDAQQNATVLPYARAKARHADSAVCYKEVEESQMVKDKAKAGTWSLDARSTVVEKVVMPMLAPRVWQCGEELICAWAPADGPAAAGVLGQVLPAWLLADAPLEIFLTITTGPKGWQSNTVAAKSELLEAAGFGAQYGVYPVRSFAPSEPIGVLAGRHVGMYRMGSARYEATAGQRGRNRTRCVWRLRAPPGHSVRESCDGH